MSRSIRRFIFFGFVLTSVMASAQRGSERQVISKIEKHQWTKAELLLRKSLKKDSALAEDWYLLSMLYFNPAFNGFDLDSTNKFAIKATRVFTASAYKQRERMKKLPLDSMILVAFRAKIDSAAFEQARQINTEESYVDFLAHYTHARQEHLAVELRDEIAFEHALKNNTISGFEDYLRKYPQSLRNHEASARHDKLLFERETKDGKLKSYETFLTHYPGSSFHADAEKNVYEISTASGEREALIAFIGKHQNNRYRKQAIDILYHLSEQERNEFGFYNDSLKHVFTLEKGYWVPVMKDHRYGFIDALGHEMISPSQLSISDAYICGDVRTDYLIVQDGIMGRNGQWIFKGDVNDVEDIGLGFLLVEENKYFTVVHKSGYRVISNQVEDAKLINENFIATKRNEKWNLVSLAGKELLPFDYENIVTLDDLIILQKAGKKIIVTVESIAAIANKQPFSDSFVFDDVRLLERGIYLVKSGALEGAINNQLQYVVPLDRQLLTKAPRGYISEKNRKFQLIAVSPALEGRDFDQVRFYGNWISLSSAYNTQLFDLDQKSILDEDLDSIWFSNRIAFTTKHDSVNVYLLSGRTFAFPAENAITFIQSPDSVNYFYAALKRKKAVFDITRGVRLFEIEADQVEYVGHHLFLITRKEGKGLIGEDGKVVLQPEYSAIVAAGKNSVSLLKGKKFGLFDLQKKMLINPEYDRNITSYNDELLVAFRDGFYGLVDWQSVPQSKFEFDEIKAWSDTTALVKKNFYWSVYSLKNKDFSERLIKSYQVIRESEQEKLIVAFRDNYYGVLSSTRGFIIAPSFSGILNVGNEEVPLYFAEKHVEEAGVFIVIYYDQYGKLLRRQVYEEDEYAKISCEDN